MTAFWIALAYGVLVFAYGPTRALHRFDPAWDLSYGVYVYGFPCQQMAAALWTGIRPLPLCVVALSMTLPLAAASWLVVERPALRLKAGWPRAKAAVTAAA
jgi:peptidoglycan/LPS O-acetylase OafA/YrhL